MTPEIAPGVIAAPEPTEVVKKILLDKYQTEWPAVLKMDRSRSIMQLRQVVQICLYKYTPMSCTDVGMSTMRDHATVINARRKLENDEFLYERYNNRSEFLNLYRQFENYYRDYMAMCGVQVYQQHKYERS